MRLVINDISAIAIYKTPQKYFANSEERFSRENMSWLFSYCYNFIVFVGDCIYNQLSKFFCGLTLNFDEDGII